MYSQHHPEIKRINQWLLDKGGYVADTIKQRFRVVWGPSQLVNRIVYDKDGNSLGYQERPKYQYNAPNAFVLECYFTTPDKQTLGTENGCYEPLWCFYDSEGRPVDPEISAIQLQMHFLELGIESTKYRTDKDAQADSAKKFEKGWKRIYDYLNSDSFMQHQLHTGSGVSYGGVKQFKE